MKNYLKTSKWLRFVAAGAFGLMLVLNIMVSLDFDKDKLLPSLTLVELGNQAYAQSESGGSYGGVCCHWLYESCQHPIGSNYADSKWFDGHSTCDTVHP